MLSSDHDGTLSLDEVKTAADARFAALDRNHDGTLERKELGGAVTAKEFAEADTDKDRTLDKKEYEAIAKKRFGRTLRCTRRGGARPRADLDPGSRTRG